MRISWIVLLSIAVACSGVESLDERSSKQDDREAHFEIANPKVVELLVLGDSLSTGAITHPDMAIDYPDLLTRFFNNRPFKPKTEHVSHQHFLNGHGDLVMGQRLYGDLQQKEDVEFFDVENIAKERVYKILETPAYAWSSLLAGSKNLHDDQVVIAAENGARVSASKEQLESYLKESGGTLPPRVAIFFSGNDLCRSGDTDAEPTEVEVYREKLGRTLGQIIQAKSKMADGEATRVLVMSHLNILQLAEKDDLLPEKKIHYHFGSGKKEVTCKEFLGDFDRAAEDSDLLERFGNKIQYHPMKLCHNMLSLLNQPNEATHQKLAATIAGYQSAAQEVVADYQGKHPGVEVVLVDMLTELQFEPDDIANDCFHLSVQGQEKIAKSLLDVF